VNRVYDFGNLWLSAHLFDLLDHAGAMERHTLPFVLARISTYHDLGLIQLTYRGIGITQRDLAVLEYVMSLVTTEMPFSLTADYLQFCGETGQRYLYTVCFDFASRPRLTNCLFLCSYYLDSPLTQKRMPRSCCRFVIAFPFWLPKSAKSTKFVFLGKFSSEQANKRLA